MAQHDIHDFVISSQRSIEAEYARIRRRATEDPGTAGDQGEENWAELFREWLPPYFHIVTKGRILTDTGYTSPQVDLLVLLPSYPKILLSKKLYLSGGVAAAFECKTTLTAAHATSAVQTAAEIHRNLPVRQGTPYREINSPIIFGLLAHSHSWKGDASTPVENIHRVLYRADAESVRHPRECIDFIAVADLASWTVNKITYLSPRCSWFDSEFARMYGPMGSSVTSYLCHAESKGEQKQEDYFSPIGVLLSALYSKLAWTFPDMRHLEEYFRKVNLGGRG